MKVFLKADVERVGIAGEIIKVSDGYAKNFLFPKKLAIEVTPENEASFLDKIKVVEKRKEVIETATSMLAEKIKQLKITIKKKIHDNDKLYGAISAQEIVDALQEEGIKVAKSQVIMPKKIMERGNHEVIIKLSSRLQPSFSLKVAGE